MHINSKENNECFKSLMKIFMMEGFVYGQPSTIKFKRPDVRHIPQKNPSTIKFTELFSYIWPDVRHIVQQALGLC